MNNTPGEAPSWEPIDLTDVLNGNYRVDPPTFMKRTDSAALLYPGKVHAFQGEPESGKSLVAQAEIAQILKHGLKALLIDFESDQGTVVDRLRKLGVSPEQIRANLHYVRPEVSPINLTAEWDAWEKLMGNSYALAVIDGVTEAFAVYGVKSVDNDEVTRWGRLVPRQIAQRTGAAVVVVDHVTKDTEGRGRFAIGAQAKMSYLTGASYSVEVVAPIGVGMAGKLALRIGKDRPGLVRPYGGQWRKSDRTQEIALAVIDSTTAGQISYSLDPPRSVTESLTDSKPLELMRAVAEAIKDSPTAPSFRSINSAVRGSQYAVKEAIENLIAEGYVRVETGERNTQRHHMLKPYPNTEALKIAV